MDKQKLIDAFESREPRTPMTEDETHFFMNILLSGESELNADVNELDKESETYKHFKPLIESFVAKVFLKRLELLTTLKMSVGALIILMMHMESPGACVMYAFYLHHKLPPNTLVTVGTFAEAFPWGFFSNKQLIEIWDIQKVGNDDMPEEWHCHGGRDNAIDYTETWVK